MNSNIVVSNNLSVYPFKRVCIDYVLSNLRVKKDECLSFFVDAKKYGEDFYGFLSFKSKIIFTFLTGERKSDEAELKTLLFYYENISQHFSSFRIFSDSLNGVRKINNSNVVHIPRNKNPLNTLMPSTLNTHAA